MITLACAECDWYVTELTHPIAGGLASWHVYENHQDIWSHLFGNRLPVDPDPRDPLVRARMLAQAGLQ